MSCAAERKPEGREPTGSATKLQILMKILNLGCVKFNKRMLGELMAIKMDIFYC